MGHNFERPVDRQPTQRSKLADNPHQHQHKTTMTFSPATVKIGKDETVTFINEDGLQHDIRFTGVPAGVDASSLNQGSWDTQFDTVSITFHEPGTYHYMSDVYLQNAGMAGTVIVA